MYVEDDENLDALLLLFIKYIFFVALCLSSKLFSQKEKKRLQR